MKMTTGSFRGKTWSPEDLAVPKRKERYSSGRDTILPEQKPEKLPRGRHARKSPAETLATLELDETPDIPQETQSKAPMPEKAAARERIDKPEVQKLDPITAARVAALRQQHKSSNTQALIEAILATLPIPHAKQRLIEESTAKRKVVNVGRRGGKTTLGARVACKKMTEGRRVLLASTTQEQADAFWEKCKLWLVPFIDSHEIIKNETRRTLEMPSTGGRIKVKTASDADMLRGDYADFLVFDECALLAENAWTEVGAPMLLDNDGDAWFLSTPRRRNWFFRLYQRAVSDGSGRWAFFTFTSYDNPYLSEEALAEIIEDLTPEAYQQEIMAVFLEGEGAVFRNIAANMTAPLVVDPAEHAGHFVVLGGDWGQKHDYTCLCVLCATCMQELFLDRFNRLEWALQRDRLINAWNMYYIRYGMVESNSIGGPNLETLVSDDKLNLHGFDTNVKTKPQMIRGLALALERLTVRWQPIPVATGELEGYEAKTSKITGHTQYSAPEGMHDDTVIARGIALFAALNGVVTLPEAETFTEIAAASARSEDWTLEEAGPSYVSYGSSTVGGLDSIGYNPAIAVPAGRPF